MPGLTLETADDNPCQCGAGKKCSCALKKETSKQDAKLNVPSASFLDRSSGKPYAPGRRSESAVPRMRNTYQPAMQRSNFASQEYGVPYHLPQSPLGRGRHGSQRSVDSLPLLDNAQPFAATGSRHPSHLLAPSPVLPQRSQSDHVLSLNTQDAFRDFNVSLDQDVLARTLSPQNPKRYSMNDWSMMTFNANDLSQFGAAPANTRFGSHEGGFPFPQDNKQWHEGWNHPIMQTPPTMHNVVTHQDASFIGQPDLSTSSTGTVSDFGDLAWHGDRPSSYASSHPTINVDSSSCPPHIYDDASNYSWTPASTHEVADFAFPADPIMPKYEQSYSGDDYLEQHSNYVNPKDFAFAGPELRQSPPTEVQYQTLPDRSIGGQWSGAPEPALNPAFKFPNDDLCFSQPYSDHIDQKEWQAYPDDNNYLELDSGSPMTR